MNDPVLAQGLIKAQGPGPAPKIDNNIRQAWNDYVDWLQTKGLKGNPALDHNDLSFKMIDQYRQEHPDTPISKDMITPIQQEFSNYRQYMLNQIKSGKGSFAKGVTADNFMPALSQVDGIAGQRTTSYKFPSGYMHDMDNGTTKNVGFMTSDKPVAQQLGQ